MSPFLVGPKGPRRRAAHGRFQRAPRLGEELASKVVQGIVGALLCGALIYLLVVAVQMLRAQFLDKYGSQAWLLPIVVGFIFVFVLSRVIVIWRQALALRREIEESRAALHEDRDD